MSVKIRLMRMGSNKKPFFRVVVLDGRRPNAGRCLEAIGWYDPKMKGVNYSLKMDRVEHWTKTGAQCSDTVASLLRKVRVAESKVAAAAAPSAS